MAVVSAIVVNGITEVGSGEEKEERKRMHEYDPEANLKCRLCHGTRVQGKDLYRTVTSFRATLAS